VIHCASDYRSAIAASLLRRAARKELAVLVGGFAAWAAGAPGGDRRQLSSDHLLAPRVARAGPAAAARLT